MAQPKGQKFQLKSSIRQPIVLSHKQSNLMPRRIPFYASAIRARWNDNLHFRLTVGLVLGIILIMTFGGFFMLYAQGKAFQEAAEARGQAYSEAFALMGSATAIKNLFLLQEAMNEYLDDPDIIQVDVIDQDNMIVAAKQTTRIGQTVQDSEWLKLKYLSRESVTYSSLGEAQVLVVVNPLRDE